MTCDCTQSPIWTGIQQSHADQIGEQVASVVTMLAAHHGMCEDGERVFRNMVTASVVAALSQHDIPAPTAEAPRGVQ